MSIVYSAGEVLEVAQQIERNGARFYTAAAEQTEASAREALLLDLAGMERVHEKTFASRSQRLSQQERTEPFYDPQGEAAAYVRAMAAGQVFDLRSDPIE
ncbi:MAG: ferritin family protein, partial [Candidatus Brocadiaceae bacterium]